MIRSAAFPLVLLSLVLAGCSGGGATPSAAEPSAGPTVALDEAGAISGHVVDTEQAPIPGAEVIIKDVARATADETGYFELAPLSAGDHMVFVQALGYNSVGRTITVKVGETTEHRFELAPLPVEGPRHETAIKDGHICGQIYIMTYFVNTGNLPCGGQGSIFVPFDVRGGLGGLVVEMQWTKNSGVTSNRLGISVWQGGSRSGAFSCTYCYGPVTGASPIKLLVQGPFEGLKDLGPGTPTKMDNTITVPADPNNPVGGLNIVVDQRTKIFDTMFYGGPADETFSALPDE